MYIILGATGQIGSLLAQNLFKQGHPVRAIVRDTTKAYELQNMGIEVAVADYLDQAALGKAFEGGDTAFLLTPENHNAENHLDDVRQMLKHYREEVQAAGIKKIVGLSSMGAQHNADTGDLVASYLLEHSFDGLPIEQIFVRPAYYYSNWIGYLNLVMTDGILPTFFPANLQLSMVAPADVAAFLADRMAQEEPQERIFEIAGPQDYSSQDIANIFAQVLDKAVQLQEVPPEAWEGSLAEAGFSADGIQNLMLMTQAVIDRKTKPENPMLARLPTDFRSYLTELV